jgi:hypothetical protein
VFGSSQVDHARQSNKGQRVAVKQPVDWFEQNLLFDSITQFQAADKRWCGHCWLNEVYLVVYDIMQMAKSRGP